MSLMIMKYAILKIIRGSIPEETTQKYLAQIADHFAKNEKDEQVSFLEILFQCSVRAKKT